MNCRSSIIARPSSNACSSALAQGLPVLPSRNKPSAARSQVFRQPSLTPETGGPKWQPLAKICAKSAQFYTFGGAVAQLGERLVRNEEVRGSTPLGSTSPTSLLTPLSGGGFSARTLPCFAPKRAYD